ncbi:MAG: NAD(P)-dependent oxidoreductase [Rhodocyclaceae bacterium]
MPAPSLMACRRIVLTGAAGRLGSMLRAPLRALYEELVLSDIAPLSEPACGNEILLPCDLADHAAVVELLRGAQMVVHMGGIPHERDFATLLPANIVGQYNLYDAALANGLHRVVLASSNHVTGFYRMDEMVDASMPMRPDSLYGVSKGYGELLASYYHDRHGLESVCLRIGACRERPSDVRGLAAWLSPADFIELVRCALLAEAPGCAVVYGVSDNPGRWWRDDDATRIGYQPRDSSARFAADLAAVTAPEPVPGPALQGGVRVMRNDYRDPASFDHGARRPKPG